MKKMTLKTILTLAALALLLTFTVSGTLAYISTSTGNVVNEFTPAKVTCAVVESFDGKTKEYVKIKNTGNTSAWIRATVVGNWVVTENNQSKVVAPWSDDIDDKYNEGTGAQEWTKVGNFWYYNSIVPVNTPTPGNLFADYKPTVPEGVPADAHLELTVVCQAVQSEPDAAVIDAWGFVPGGSN